MNKSEHNKLINEPGQIKEQTFNRWTDKTHIKYEPDHIRFPLIMENITGPKILDVGCGSGLVCYLSSLRDDIKEIHGIDLQKSILEDARVNVKSDKVMFHQGSAEELPFEDCIFNTVVLTEVIEHVYDVDLLFSESNRVLIPGGQIVLSCPYKGKISDPPFTHVRTISKTMVKTWAEKYFKIERLDIIMMFKNKIFCVAVK